MTDGSGPTSPTPFAYYDPERCSWRTSQGSFDLGEMMTDGGTRHRSRKSLATWPRSGTWDLGSASERQTWAPPTSVTGCSSLLPSPMAQEPGGTIDGYRARLAGHDGRESTFTPLSMLAPALLPTPTVNDSRGGAQHDREPDQPEADDEHRRDDPDGLRLAEWWEATELRRKYAPAVRRWEHLTRPAPHPLERSHRSFIADRYGEFTDRWRLNPAFSEWMMGLPAGWVTGCQIPTTAQHKAIGNGVVPQAVAAAWAHLHGEPVAPITGGGTAAHPNDLGREGREPEPRGDARRISRGPAPDAPLLGQQRGGASRQRGAGPADDRLLATPTAWIGHRPTHSRGDRDRWMNPDRSRELPDQLAWLETDHDRP